MNDITKMDPITEEATTEIAERETMGIEYRPIEIITAEILVRKQRAGEDILGIGRCLMEAKEQLTHGEWLPWLAEKVEFSEVSAQRFMRLAREYTNPSLVTDLGASKALALLALPASERDEFVAEKHDVDGEEKTVAEMSKRELEKAIKERDEARRQAAVVEESQAKLTAERDQAEADRQATEAEVIELKEKLEALKNAPVPVATEQIPDKAAIADAVAKAEEKLKAKIEKAEKAKAQAESAKAKAEQELAAAKVAQEEAETRANQEKNILKDQVDALQKKLAVASSSDMTVFRAYFDQTKENINKMAECINRMTEAGDVEGAGRLKAALGALLTATQEVLK